MRSAVVKAVQASTRSFSRIAVQKRFSKHTFQIRSFSNDSEFDLPLLAAFWRIFYTPDVESRDTAHDDEPWYVLGVDLSKRLRDLPVRYLCLLLLSIS
jgi:hypothetical protein